ncbi:UNVERIFIED_CONTAM: hypothetical protein NCL1_49576 [Trichonephila clavipes]
MSYPRISNPSFRRLLHKYDVTDSEQNNPSKPLEVDNTARLSERYFISHIPPTLAKCQPISTLQSLLLKKGCKRKKCIRNETRFSCNNC